MEVNMGWDFCKKVATQKARHLPGNGCLVNERNQRIIEHDGTLPGKLGQQVQQHVVFLNMDIM
jgi:hypothetical protein